MIGDALAMAAWVQLFWEGLIVDPHEVFASASDAALASVVGAFVKGSGVRRIAATEQAFRIGALSGPWGWRVVGIGRAVIELQFQNEVEFLTLEVWARAA